MNIVYAQGSSFHFTFVYTGLHMPDEGLPEDGFLGDRSALEGFEWDPKKNVANIAKHGIGFFRALRVFSDLTAVTMDASFVSGEQRRLIIGQVDNVVITVVYTLRGDRVRIISARSARRSERKRYGQ